MNHKTKKSKKIPLGLLILSFSFYPFALAEITTNNTPFTLIATENHNPTWFTQGLYQDQESLIISSGQYGRSQLIKKTPEKVLAYSLPARYFAEGLTVIGDKIYLLTWKENTLLVFDKNTLKHIKHYPYQGEGWGLTHNKDSFIMSNGSKQLTFRDFDTFKIKKTLTVKNLDKINELEYVNGIIWANRWYDDHLYAIDELTGCVLNKVNVRSLREQATTPDRVNVTNGIAYDTEQQGLWVTGKYWPKRFLIKLPKVQKRPC